MSQNVADLRSLPLDRFCNLVWYWFTKDMTTATDRAKFETFVYRPPKGIVPTKGPWTPEAETAAFQGLRASLSR